MIIVVLILLGACLASFINALTWRMHQGRTGSMLSERSACEHCHKTLGPLELIPLLSWVALHGKCRHCKKPIGIEHPLIEISLAVAFALSYIFWPAPLSQWYEVAQFVIWLVMLTGLAALFIYDLRWYLLPDAIVYPLIGLAVVSAVLQFTTQPQGTPFEMLQFYLLGLLPIAGLYWLIYTLSKGRLVGFGDVKLGVFIGLALGWPGALLTLLLANLIGSLIVLPLLLLKKVSRSTRVPFGPLLIAGFFIAGLWGEAIISWYLSFTHLSF